MLRSALMPAPPGKKLESFLFWTALAAAVLSSRHSGRRVRMSGAAAKINPQIAGSEVTAI